MMPDRCPYCGHYHDPYAPHGQKQPLTAAGLIVILLVLIVLAYIAFSFATN